MPVSRHTRPQLIIWLLKDGKAGHQNQALALIEALQLRLPVAIQSIAVPASAPPGLALLQALIRSSNLPSPDLVVGAGHRTHGALITLTWLRRSRSLVVMRPSLPLSWFGRVVAPSHDFAKAVTSTHLIATFGPLCRQHRQEECNLEDKDKVVSSLPGTLILLGGPSRHYGFDLIGLQAHLEGLLESHHNPGGWFLVESRRTPKGAITNLAQALGLGPRQLRLWQSCPPGWLADSLARCPEVWVTEDSMSMIFEAVSAGCRVGLLPMPRKGRASRLQPSLERLLSEGYVSGCSSLMVRGALQQPPPRLQEAVRVADLLAPWLLDGNPKKLH